MNENIPQRMLSGKELKAIMIEKFSQLLRGDTMLGDFMAYGRIRYDITLRYQVGNMPDIVNRVSSEPIGKNILPSMPELEALEGPLPMKDPPPDTVTGGDRVSHMIDNPNFERLAHGLPIPVDVKQSSGAVVTEEIKYPIDYPLENAKNVRFEDVSSEVKAELGNK